MAARPSGGLEAMRMQWETRAGALAPQAVIDAIDYGCRLAGAPRGIVCAVIEIESAFNIKAKNAKSKAAGLLQIKPEYLEDYQGYAGCKFDPSTIAAAIAGGEIFDRLAAIGRSRGFAGNAAWQFAMAAHRYGMASEDAKTPSDSPRALEVEAMMRANGVWYDAPDAFAATVKNVRWLVETMQAKHGFSVANVVGHSEGYQRGIASNHGDPTSDPGYIYSAKAPWRNPAMNGKGYYRATGTAWTGCAPTYWPTSGRAIRRPSRRPSSARCCT